MNNRRFTLALIAACLLLAGATFWKRAQPEPPPVEEISGPINTKLADEMLSRRLDEVDWINTPFEEVVRDLERMAHVSLSVRWRVKEDLPSAEDEFRRTLIILNGHNLTVAQALAQILPQITIRRLTFAPGDGVIVICDDAGPEFKAIVETKIYNVRDIIEQGRIPIADDQSLFTDDYNSFFGLLRRGAGFETDPSGEHNTGATLFLGLLVVTDTPRNLARVSPFLERLRGANGERAWKAATMPATLPSNP